MAPNIFAASNNETPATFSFSEQRALVIREYVRDIRIRRMC